MYYNVLITRGKEGRKEEGDRSERVDREEEGGRGGGGGKGGEGLPPRTNVVGGSALNAVVAHAEVCTPLDAWMSRAVASTRRQARRRFASRAVAPTLLPVSTLQY